jgi:hypothetical protein
VETETVSDRPRADLIEIKEKIGRGKYRVHESVVADAILRRWRERNHAALRFQSLDVTLKLRHIWRKRAGCRGSAPQHLDPS